MGDLLRRLQTLSRFLPFTENDLGRLVLGLIFKTDPSSPPLPTVGIDRGEATGIFSPLLQIERGGEGESARMVRACLNPKYQR